MVYVACVSLVSAWQVAYRQPAGADGQLWDPSSPLDDDATKADDAEVTASWGDSDTVDHRWVHVPGASAAAEGAEGS